MSNEFDYDLSFVKNKKTRHFHYEMKVIGGKQNVILHARKSKKGGASISKMFDDAMFLLANGLIDFEGMVKSGELDKIITMQEKLYEDSPKIDGIAFFGWSPKDVENLRRMAKEVKEK